MIIEITDISHEGLAPYFSLTEKELRREDLFIAESPNVIERGLDAGVRPVSFLCEASYAEKAWRLIGQSGDIPVFTGPGELLASITGYKLSRGMLCAMERPPQPSVDSLLTKGSRVCVLYDICDAVNVGAIFRTAAALGYDAILLSPTTCDPLNRRTVRVSMGAVFQIPWCYADGLPEILTRNDYRAISMALSPNSVFLDEFKTDGSERYAVILGNEGFGLPKEIIDNSDAVVKIPISDGVDSLNVAAAAAIAMWQFRK